MPKCPLCLGTRQAFWEEWDVVSKMWVTIHGDNQCQCMRRCPDCGERPCLFYDSPCGATQRDALVDTVESERPAVVSERPST